MTTAVVVTSIVTTNLGEAKFVDHVLEQVRRNDRDLLNKISAVDIDARVVTAILNVNDFMSYAHEWLRQRQDDKLVEPVLPKQKNGTAKATAGKTRIGKTTTGKTTTGKTTTGKTTTDKAITDKTIVVSDNMNEAEFMDYTLEQLRQGKVQAFASFSAEELDNVEEEPIGEDFSQQPFLY